MDDFWVFGYGSLMWNPGFDHEERVAAQLFGYRRALCVRSWVHRGTKERPGLVLGLDRGGSCRGIAFRVTPDNRESVIAYLRERELVTHVYLERTIGVKLIDGRRVPAMTYVIDPTHIQYAGNLGVLDAAQTVHAAVGKSGPNDAYLLSTLEHMREMGVRDQWLEAVGSEVLRLSSARASS